MQVHVLGVGAIGTLLAGRARALQRVGAPGVPGRKHRARAAVPPHIARYLPDALDITLHIRKRPSSSETPRGHVTIERDGQRTHESGYTLEEVSAASPETLRTWAPGEHEMVPTAPATTPIDCLLVATKADATLRAMARLLPRITPATTIVLVQNGMGVLDTLLDKFWRDPAKRPNVVLASTTHGCYLKRQLHTIHASFGSMHLGIVPHPRGPRDMERPLPGSDTFPPALDLAAIPEGPNTDSLRATMALLLALPLDVHWEPIRAFQLRALRKLIINACINPTTALVDCKNGELYGKPDATDLFRVLCTEASQVLEAHARDARASGDASSADAEHLSSLPLADLLTQTDADGLPLLDASLRPASVLRAVENTVQATAANWSSMHQDVQLRRASTEIDYINGYLSELGRAYGIPTPANDALTALVKLKSRRLTGSWKRG